MQHYFAVQKKDDNFILNPRDWHHIKNVMRMSTGDNIIVVYDNSKYLCSVDVLNSIVKIISKQDSVVTDEPRITIAQGLIREQKLDTVLKMCTELGMYEYYPIIMIRSVVKLDKQLYDKKVNRWQMICKEAAEQSHRNQIPIIGNILTVDELSKLDYDIKLVCSTSKNLTNIKNILQKSRICDKMLIVVGPEGGIDPKEEQLLIDRGFVPVSLGDKILRTETAPVYINSIINYALME